MPFRLSLTTLAVALGAAASAPVARGADVDADEGMVARADGSLVIRPGTGREGEVVLRLRAPRWGMFELFLHTRAALAAGDEVAVSLDGKALGPRKIGVFHEGTACTLGTLYLAREGEHEIVVSFGEGAAARRSAASVAKALLRPAPEGGAIGQSEDGGPIELHARDATAWGRKLRYEPNPEKRCLGFWVDPGDFPEWRFRVTRAGAYRVVVHQGCGRGHGGSEVEVVVGGQRLPFTVLETGHFQVFEPVEAGVIEMAEPGEATLSVRVRHLKAGAVMDIRRIELVPVDGAGTGGDAGDDAAR